MEERERKDEGLAGDKRQNAAAIATAAEPATALRSNFSETAFWKPHLLTGPDGSASIEFTVPDSVTSWNVWIQAVTKDLKAGALTKETKSVKELMVRPYVPRFLREGDLAELKVVVNNASDKGMSGKVTLDILDTVTNASALARLRAFAREGHAAVLRRGRGGIRRDVPPDDAETRGLLCDQGHGGLGRATRTASSGRCRSCPAGCSSRSRASPRCGEARAGR